MAQIPASRGVQTQKLDEILRKLDGQPSVEDWHDMATVLSDVSREMKHITEKVIKLHDDINGNGKPGLKTDVHDLKKSMSIVTRITWGIVGVFTSAVGYGLIKLIQIGGN